MDTTLAVAFFCCFGVVILYLILVVNNHWAHIKQLQNRLETEIKAGEHKIPSRKEIEMIALSYDFYGPSKDGSYYREEYNGRLGDIIRLLINKFGIKYEFGTEGRLTMTKEDN